MQNDTCQKGQECSMEKIRIKEQQVGGQNAGKNPSRKDTVEFERKGMRRGKSAQFPK